MKMVEKIARATAKDDNKNKPWEELSAPSCKVYLSLAIAALKAMREPTEEMGRIVRERHGFADAANYRAHIDAALEAQKEEER